MAEVIVCRPMQDEPAWGQFIRLARLNGLNSRRALAKLLPLDAPFGSRGWIRYRKHIAHLLSGTQRRSDMDEYFRSHYVYPLIIGARYWFGPGKTPVYHWNAHHSIYYPSPRVVRSCGDCSQEDIEKAGFAWFKREHQLPGVKWCWRHQCLLHERKVLNDLFQNDGWMALRPQSRRVGSDAMQPFVHRYVRVLHWLGSKDGRRKWDEFWKTLVDTLLIDQTTNHPYCAFDELISVEAPTSWLEAQFLDPQRESRRQFSGARRDDGPLLALSAAAISRSDRDVDELIDLTVKLADENYESMRRWLKGTTA